MSEKKVNKSINLVFTAGIAMYVFFEKITYSGIYRLAAEKQLALSGSYSEKYTLLASGLVYIIIGIIVMLLINKIFPELGLLGKVVKIKPEITYSEYKRLRAKKVLALGIGLFAISAIAFFAGSHFFDNPEPSFLNIEKEADPRSSWVDVAGTAQVNYIIEYSEKRGGIQEKYIVVPITSADWKQGQPIKYFIRAKQEELMDRQNKKHNILKERENFTISFAGYVMKNGLEGMVTEAYKRHQIALASPYYLIDEQKPVNKSTAAGAWLIASILILVVFGGYGLYLFSQAREAEKKEA